MKKVILKVSGILCIILSLTGLAQAPVANFSISPNPVCSGSLNLVQVTDNSTNSPTAWSYTIANGGPGPGAITTTSQNPVLSFNQQGTYSITLVATNSSGASIPVTHTLLVLASPNAQINPQTQSSCIGGNPLTITALTGGPGAGALTFSWSTGASGSSVSVSPSVTTVYTCVITSTNGCSSERTATVTIAQPIITITSNPVSICPGSSSTITATGTAPGPMTYSWSTGATTRTISTAIAGVYTVTVINGNGCSATQTYSIGSSTTLSLTATSVPAVLCAGNTATLHVTGASSYTWSNGAATQNSSVNPVTATTYTVIGEIGTCTGTAAITLSVNVTPTVIASANTSVVCAGNAVILNASGATTYTWLPSTVSQSTSVSPIVNTTYTVRGNNPGCQNRTATISINVAPKPLITVTSSSSLVCAGEVVALAANGAVTYTWSEGGNTAIVLVTPSVTTTYTVAGSNSSNCSATTTILQNVSVCSGITKNQTEVAGLHVFPNPNVGSFSIEVNTDMDLKITNQSGQLISSYSMKAGSENSLTISNLEAGIYFLTGRDKNEIVKQKIIVLK